MGTLGVCASSDGGRCLAPCAATTTALIRAQRRAEGARANGETVDMSAGGGSADEVTGGGTDAARIEELLFLSADARGWVTLMERKGRKLRAGGCRHRGLCRRQCEFLKESAGGVSQTDGPPLVLCRDTKSSNSCFGRRRRGGNAAVVTGDASTRIIEPLVHRYCFGKPIEMDITWIYVVRDGRSVLASELPLGEEEITHQPSTNPVNINVVLIPVSFCFANVEPVYQSERNGREPRHESLGIEMEAGSLRDGV
ncbi:hypothetical protein C8R47DRAFT_1084169 [Mycena vitilis]|nr:hypothetical protein C8R47DRAFT_1084169 [Mycena vitilis]